METPWPMRTSATLFVVLVTAFTVAQTPGDTLTMYFDTPGEPLQLDSVYPAGCWQVGTPTKPVFTSAFSPGKALVTDTLLPHPANTMCYAEFTLLTTDWDYLGRTIQYKQQLDMDTTSQASVEVFDPGLQTWRRFGALTGGDEYVVGQSGDGTGYTWTCSSGGWEDVWLEAPCWGLFWSEGEKDAEWYDPLMRLRFVFESLGNPDSLDGWMIDNVRASVSFCAGSVGESFLDKVRIHPSPASSNVAIDLGTASQESLAITVFTSDGSMVTNTMRFNGGQARIDVSSWMDGLYLIRIEQEGQYTSRRIIVQH